MTTTTCTEFLNQRDYPPNDMEARMYTSLYDEVSLPMRYRVFYKNRKTGQPEKAMRAVYDAEDKIRKRQGRGKVPRTAGDWTVMRPKWWALLFCCCEEEEWVDDRLEVEHFNQHMMRDAAVDVQGDEYLEDEQHTKALRLLDTVVLPGRYDDLGMNRGANGGQQDELPAVAGADGNVAVDVPVDAPIARAAVENPMVVNGDGMEAEFPALGAGGPVAIVDEADALAIVVWVPAQAAGAEADPENAAVAANEEAVVMPVAEAAVAAAPAVPEEGGAIPAIGGGAQEPPPAEAPVGGEPVTAPQVLKLTKPKSKRGLINISLNRVIARVRVEFPMRRGMDTTESTARAMCIRRALARYLTQAGWRYVDIERVIDDAAGKVDTPSRARMRAHALSQTAETKARKATVSGAGVPRC